MLKTKSLLAAAIAATMAAAAFAAPAAPPAPPPGAAQGVGMVAYMPKPATYEGHCMLRYEKGQRNNVGRTMPYGGMVDICLPVNWKIHSVAASDTARWLIQDIAPNVVVVKPIDSLPMTNTIWVYPIDEAGRMQDKMEIVLDANRKEVSGQ